MKLELPLRYLIEIHNEKPKELSEEDHSKISRFYNSEIRYQLDRRDIANDSMEIDNKYVTLGAAKYLLEKCQGRGRCHVKGRRHLETYIDLHDNPEGAKVQELRALPRAVDAYMKQLPHHWIFKHIGKDKHLQPFVYEDATYVKPREGSPYVSIKFKATRFGSSTDASITIYGSEVKGGITVSDLFYKNNILIENEKLVKNYEKDLKRFRELRGKIGMQLLGFGFAESYESRRWYSNHEVPLLVEGEKSRLVIDQLSDEELKIVVIKNKFYKETDDEENTIPERLECPIIPTFKLFGLDMHKFVTVHINNVEPYKYDNSLIEKLVIDQEHKDLIKILTESDGSLLEDIIAGKTGGIFILGTGEPGLGKTLTAEIISEFIEAPLYKVQCSQLGVDTDKIESNLTDVLQRSNRWGAILLIDEADVYIRKRSSDIQQNAIVGVFLRLIEYYKGILFMTTNLGDDVDDAIKSRATAEIQYNYPDEDDRRSIWKIISDQYDLNLSEELIVDLGNEFDDVSGRDIKNILKLVKLVATKKDIEVTLELIKSYKKYVKR